jgi:hypothetical protein
VLAPETCNRTSRTSEYLKPRASDGLNVTGAAVGIPTGVLDGMMVVILLRVGSSVGEGVTMGVVGAAVGLAEGGSVLARHSF